MAGTQDLPHQVYRDDLIMAYMDLRQSHPGHVIVMPIQNFRDVRDLDHLTGAALMSTVSKITGAVGTAFPSDGISLWHSIPIHGSLRSLWRAAVPRLGPLGQVICLV